MCRHELCVEERHTQESCKLRSRVFCRLGLLCRPGLLRLCLQMMGKHEHTEAFRTTTAINLVFLFKNRTVWSAHSCTLGENYSQQTILCVAASYAESTVRLHHLCLYFDRKRAHGTWASHARTQYFRFVVTDSFKTSGKSSKRA